MIESEDDSICLKSHSLAGMKDVLITNKIVTNHRANAIKIGTATLGPIENIRILNNTVESAMLGGLCLESVDTGQFADSFTCLAASFGPCPWRECSSK